MKPQTAPRIDLEAIMRPTKDVLTAATTLSGNEVRYIVDAYYQMQEYRKATANQIRSMEQGADEGAAHATLDWLLTQVSTMGRQIERAMDKYSLAHPAGRWLQAQYGIGLNFVFKI